MSTTPHEDQQLFREVKRQEIIERAVRDADRIIMNGSDGTVEETNFLTAQVAKRFMEKSLNHFTAQILKKDLGV